MDPTASSRPDGQTASPLTGTLLGAALAVTGITLAVLTIQTPFVARAMPGGADGSASSAAPARLGAGDRGRGQPAGVGRRPAGRLSDGHAIGRRPATPLARVLAGLPDDIAVVDGSPSRDGRPGPGWSSGRSGSRSSTRSPLTRRSGRRVRRGNPGPRTVDAHRAPDGPGGTPGRSAPSRARPRPTSTSSHGSTRRS